MVKFHIQSFITFVFVLLFVNPFQGQDIGIGEWRTHLPYNQVIGVAVTGDVIFAATPYSMFTYNTVDNSVTRVDKVKGLSDVEIIRIGYNKKLNMVLVAYKNTNMDLIHSDGTVVNIPDIKDKDILGKKTINNIMFKDKYAYLSCGFGIVVLDMAREEIYDTYYIGPEGSFIEVFDMTFNDTSFFAATESGIYYADVNAENLADYNQWHKDMRLIHPDLTYNIIQSFAGNVYTNYYNAGEYDGDTLFAFNGTKWDYFAIDNKARHFQFMVNGDEMYMVSRNNISVFDVQGKEIHRIWKVADESIQPLSVDKGSDKYVWIGDVKKGLIKNWNVYNGEFIKLNGPGTANVFDLDAGGKNVWVAPGGRQANWGKQYMRDGVFAFIDNTWYTHNSSNIPALDTISDLVITKVDPQNPSVVFVGSWDHGLLKFVDNELQTIFTDENSTLQRWVANPKKILISGLDFDDQHNLWVANSSAPDILSVMKNDGQWRSFNLGGSLSAADVTKLIVDKTNQKWLMKRTDGYLIVFNDNNTIDNPNDDKVKVLGASTGNGGIAGSKVYSMAVDLDGEIWIGTDKGINVFYSPENVFEPGANYDARQILVPRNDGSGLADILLETETVTAIAIDGANNKWIGTDRAGVFYLSSDGIVQLAHFTISNSPLLSNSITGITIDDDGEVFIGTAKGLISYRGTATPPPKPGSEVYAYPNPVRPEYHGLIAIKGVANKSSVKITDSSGNLVFETRSEGGQAIWDGKNFDGRDAVSGVYLVFVTNDDGSSKMVTKILVIR